MDTRWLTPAEMNAWRSYIETFADLNSALERDLSDFGLTLGDYQVLVYLSEAENHAMRMCDLADALQLSPSGVTRRLDGLVAAGSVVREGSRADRRVMMAVLTPAGHALLERSAPRHAESVQQRIFDHLDRKQVASMHSIFAAIADGLRREGATDTEAVA